MNWPYKIGWQPHTQPNKTGRGTGIAFAQYKNIQCYAAIAVELTVDRESGEIKLERVVIAADSGQIVNPDGLSNQLEGGFVQTPAAIANAVFNAVGVRLRQIPFTPERVRDAISG